MPDQNPIYDFLKSNKLTDLDEKSFVSKYSAPENAKEIYSFFIENKLTDLDSAGFYDKYLKKKLVEKYLPLQNQNHHHENILVKVKNWLIKVLLKLKS